MMNPKILYRLKEQHESQRVSSGVGIRIATLVIILFMIVLMVMG